jgi:cell division protein FtsL
MSRVIPSRPKFTFDLVSALAALILAVAVIFGALDRASIRREIAQIRQEISRCHCVHTVPAGR